MYIFRVSSSGLFVQVHSRGEHKKKKKEKSVPFIVPLELGPTPTTIHNPTHIAAGT